MYHFQWLALRIAELGGDISVARYPVYLEAPSFKELILLDSKAEKEAVSQYKAHIAEIVDPRTISLLERIISDEERHAEKFALMAEKVADVEKSPGEELSPEAEAKRNKLIEMLNSGVKHEYSVVLQYLHQAYSTKDRGFGHSLEQSAITEMKHMGWLAEHVAEMGGKPPVERNTLILADKEEDMIKANIEDEEKALDLYEQQIADIEDEELKQLLETIRYHEEYHKEEFEYFLKQSVEKAAKEKTAPVNETKRKVPFTVGSLIKK